MTGLLQVFEDTKMIVATDRRVWAACGFLVAVVLLYFATTAWREEEPPPPEEMMRMRLEPFEWKARVTKFTKALEESHDERRKLHNLVSRASNDLRVQQQELDWQANELIEKLNSMTDKVDGLVNRFGGQSVQNAVRDKKFEASRGKSRRKVPVDRSNL